MGTWNKLSLSLSLVSILSVASPVETHLFSPADVIKRLDQPTNADLSRRLLGTGKAVILTEPLIRTLWAGQIISDSDWIGIQALATSSQHLNPGEVDDASNMFVYTCKGGWVDMGHAIHSALAYKGFLHAVKGNSLLQKPLEKYLTSDDQKIYRELLSQRRAAFKEIRKAQSFDVPLMNRLLRSSIEIRLQRYLQSTGQILATSLVEKKINDEIQKTLVDLEKGATLSGDRKEIFESFWAGFFAMQSGYQVELRQDATKLKHKNGKLDGNDQSAWTLEDLPSDSYGVLLGARLTRKNVFMSSAMKQIKAEVASMLQEFGAVDLSNVTDVKGCGKTAKDVLVSDTRYYTEAAGSTQVTHVETDSRDPASPYNYTVHSKRTRSHACVCDRNDVPINRHAYQSIEERKQSH